LYVCRKTNNLSSLECSKVDRLKDILSQPQTTNYSLDPSMTTDLLKILLKQRELNDHNLKLFKNYNNLVAVEQAINYVFTDRSLIPMHSAMIHGNNGYLSNEIFEHTGDALLDLLAIHFYYYEGSTNPHNINSKVKFILANCLEVSSCLIPDTRVKGINQNKPQAPHSLIKCQYNREKVECCKIIWKKYHQLLHIQGILVVRSTVVISGI
jgi:hypothetical protein